MKIYEVTDEHERMNRWYATLEESTGEVVMKTHTYSYPLARQMYQEMGNIMGFDKEKWVFDKRDSED